MKIETFNKAYAIQSKIESIKQDLRILSNNPVGPLSLEELRLNTTSEELINVLKEQLKSYESQFNEL